jgi:hypothetical protein
MPPTKRELWRLDAEHADNDESHTRFFVDRAAGGVALAYYEADGFYCDLYRVRLVISRELSCALCAGDWPNAPDEAIVELARNPVAKAEGDLARIKAAKKRKGKA